MWTLWWTLTFLQYNHHERWCMNTLEYAHWRWIVVAGRRAVVSPGWICSACRTRGWLWPLLAWWRSWMVSRVVSWRSRVLLVSRRSWIVWRWPWILRVAGRRSRRILKVSTTPRGPITTTRWSTFLNWWNKCWLINANFFIVLLLEKFELVYQLLCVQWKTRKCFASTHIPDTCR